VSATDIRETVYPRLPDILAEDALAAIATLESGERSFAMEGGSTRTRYLRALYLKAMAYLGRSSFSPGGLSRQFRVRIAEELGLSRELADMRSVGLSEKSRIVGAVREFLRLEPYSKARRLDLERYLARGAAAEHGDSSAIINEAVGRLRSLGVELPAFHVLCWIADRAATVADERLERRFSAQLAPGDGEKLDSLLDGAEDSEADGKGPQPRSWLEWLKQPTGRVGIKTMEHELARLRHTGHYCLEALAKTGLSRRKLEHFAIVAQRYHAAELRQLCPPRRRLILASYLSLRRAELLDSAVELLCALWVSTSNAATDHADGSARALMAAHEEIRRELKGLLGIIRGTETEHELWRQIHRHRSREQYDALWQKLETSVTWTDTYHEKLRDHYAPLRRFVDDWYELVPLVATTADDSLVRAVAYLRQHLAPAQTELLAPGAPCAFLKPEWESRAVERHPHSSKPIRIHKAPYELAVLDSLASALKEGRVAVRGARRYAPMTEHLLPREEFLEQYAQCLAQLGRSADAASEYGPLREELEMRLRNFEAQYESLERRFWINRSGCLSYSRPPAQAPSTRAQRIALVLGERIPKVSVLEVLLDCHRLTRFLDCFQPIAGLQKMSEEHRVLQLLATLYAYGCNCGPSQAAEATGLRKQDILYMRRRYTGPRQLAAAAAVLAEAYRRTAAALRLGDPGITMTDSMAFSTLEESITAKPHFRYAQGKSILLFQHVSSQLVCLFTQAILCNVSEALRMIRGVLLSRKDGEHIINLCDSAGKSDLAFGLGHLLNIEIWPRVSSGHLKLWAAGEDLSSYSHIREAIAGRVNWERIGECWSDMMWVLASIQHGQADPGLILDNLLYHAKHPATVGFQELGKAVRSCYLLRYGMDMELRRLVMRYTVQRETWNRFGRLVLHARGGIVREKHLADQEEVFWFLTVVQNAIVLWNGLALEEAIKSARADGIEIPEEELKHVLPLMVEHINFVGHFALDMNRRPPFNLVA
jgi:TnpA family transposase